MSARSTGKTRVASSTQLTPARAGILQRKCACGTHTVGGSNCASCAKKEETLQRRAAHGNESAHDKPAVPESVHQVLGNAGHSLDNTTRTFMESRFGHDFSHVRVHTNAQAAESAHAVDALAYTVGQNVVFGAGRYEPGTKEGRRLLAHELTHVVQQGGESHSLSPKAEVSSPSDASEREAERVAEAVSGADVALYGGRQEEQRARGNRTDMGSPVRGFAGEQSREMLAGSLLFNPSFNITHFQGLPRLARATFNVGKNKVEINYGNLINVPVSNYVTEIETRFTSWTGSPATLIHSNVVALTTSQQEWVMYGLDVLVDNTKPSHSALNRVQAVELLIKRAPSSSTRALGTASLDFEKEVLRVSGWNEVALSADLVAPTADDLVKIKNLYNPPSSSSSSTLDDALLKTLLPPALKAFLEARDPAKWTKTGTQPLGTVQSLGDQVQEVARSFFAPYADTAINNVYSKGWAYSANIFSVTAGTPDKDERIGLLLNRAEVVGRETRVGGTIFSKTNFQSDRPPDRAVLLSIATAMEADPAIAALVDRLIKHTGRTERVPSLKVGISTEINLSSATECQARWKTLDTLTHELVHALVHPSFPATARSIDFGQIVREGFTEVLGVQLHKHIVSKAGSDPTFKAKMETGITGAPCSKPEVATIGYGEAGASAEKIRKIVLDDNFRAAYFLGAVKLVGL